MNMLTKNKIDLGKMYVGETKIVEVTPHKDLAPILQLKTSCGCDSSRYNSSNNTLHIVQKGYDIPKHLKDRGWYVSNKILRLQHIDGTITELSVTATIFET